ncbi:uncharacterized protein LOC131852672 [Achroia grisella]|uniref:uncharacterized protein LOC131852672 n=1 Tax=Achroia grisella TaxID=688607 RepID=UPI0027D2257C|nr:uncharacterized protein LOC131852672 [Achroia grisella]
MTGFHHKRTTVYNPACNGLVERFHRQLKTSMMCHAKSSWTESLPWVLLGIRSSFKEDLQASPADLIYGEPIRLPGEFFDRSSEGSTDVTDFLARLCTFAEKIKLIAASRHRSDKIFIFNDLATTNYVFLREDALRSSLQPAYTGPYLVTHRGDKIFKLLVKGKEDTVSIDRL